MSNEISKPKTSISTVQQFQVDLALQVEKGLNEVGQTFTEYGKQCVINAIAAVITTVKGKGIMVNDIDQTMLKIALTNIGLTELNFNATPAEAFIDLRKGQDGKYSIAIRPQGAGNEKLTRRFGLNVAELKTALLIREGDEYTLPGFDGEKMTPFKWTPKSLDKKVIMVVYPLLKKDGTYEYLMATRDSIIPNIIAQIRQNNLYTFKTPKERDDFYEKVNAAFEGKTLDEIFAMPEWRKELSNTYTSGGSKEAMIIRKMKNNALKNYPREFDNLNVAQAVTVMNEDYDESLNEKPTPKGKVIDADPVEKVEKEINETPASENAPKDFDVSDDGEIKETPKDAPDYESEL